MPVATRHPQYQLYYPVWTKTRDAVKGSVAIKDKRVLYLPVPDAEDNIRASNTSRYRQYIKRAVFTNYTGRTKNALVGAAFRKEMEYELPPEIEHIHKNATGDGLGIEQLAKDQLSDLLETGRSFLLVDYPEAGSNMSAEEVEMYKLQPSIIPYTAEQVTNWQTSSIGGKSVLSLVVLAEDYNNSDDEFGHDTMTQYRVLRLNEDGYSQQLYRDDEPYTEEVYPTKADGSKWEYIPATFVGSKNNDATIDDPPLADIADVNVAHYRNSADYEESCFITGQPTLFITHSLSPDAWAEYNPQGIKLGARAGHVLGETGSATLLQPNANQLVMSAMEQKENAMVSIGARIITDRSGNETAEGARIRFASENSVLGDIVGNLNQALMDCLYWCGEFVGITGEFYVAINREFYDKSVDPQLIMSMVQLMDRSIISPQDIFDRVKAADIVKGDRVLEDVQDEVGDLSPLQGLNVNE